MNLESLIGGMIFLSILGIAALALGAAVLPILWAVGLIILVVYALVLGIRSIRVVEF